MHLPPLDVAVYPVVALSHGHHSRRTTRAPSIVSSSSSSSYSSVSSKNGSGSPDFATIQRAIRNVFRSTKINVQQVERLQGRLHQVFLARLADGSSLVLKCPPTFNTRLLRHEKYGMETEHKTLETLREYTHLTVPQVLKFDRNGGSLGSAFIMTSHIPGRRLSDIAPYLASNEREVIDRTLGGAVLTLTTLSATQFGSTHRVFSKKGDASWREAFLALLESVLRDGEDMLVTVPYDSIRYYIQRHKKLLDEITEPRLVALDIFKPQNVLINEQSKQINGIVGFSNVIWGDPLMSGGMAEGSDAFFAGFGRRPLRSGSEAVRQHMYATLRATTQIVTHYYRPSDDIDENGSSANAIILRSTALRICKNNKKECGSLLPVYNMVAKDPSCS